MSEKNLVVTVHPFTYKEINIEKRLEDKGILVTRNYAIFEALHCLLNFNATERIGELDAPIGETFPWTYEYLGKKTGMCRRSAIRAIKELKDNDIIETEKVTVRDENGIREVNKARILYFDEYIQELRDDPDHPKHQFVALRAEAMERKALRDEAIIGDDTESRGSDTDAHNQESLDSYRDPPVSNKSTGTRKSGEGGDFSNQEKQEGDTFDAESIDVVPVKEYEEKASLREKQKGDIDFDTVPNGYIGREVDKLTKSAQMKPRPSEDDSLELFVSAFNEAFGIEAGVVLTGTEAQQAEKCREYLDDRCRAAGLQLPPLLFLKRFCIERTKQLFESGELPEMPKRVWYYSETVKGKEIVEWGLARAKSVHGAASSASRTKAYLDGLRTRRLENSDRPKIDINELVANANTPEAREAARKARSNREK